MRFEKVNILLTGPPGSGKTRLVQKIVDELKKQNVAVGGLLTPEVRVQGERTGFYLLDLSTGEKELMADVNINSDIKVGRYGVSVGVIKDLGVNALNRAINKSDIIIIDEIGKMELYSKEFQNAVEEALSSSKPLLGTIGEKLRHPFTMRIKSMPSVKVITMTRSNWSDVYSQVNGMLLQPEAT